MCLLYYYPVDFLQTFGTVRVSYCSISSSDCAVLFMWCYYKKKKIKKNQVHPSLLFSKSKLKRKKKPTPDGALTGTSAEASGITSNRHSKHIICWLRNKTSHNSSDSVSIKWKKCNLLLATIFRFLSLSLTHTLAHFLMSSSAAALTFSLVLLMRLEKCLGIEVRTDSASLALNVPAKANSSLVCQRD